MLLTLTGCDHFVGTVNDRLSLSAQDVPKTAASYDIENLPPPRRLYTVAVYEFQDRTGQRKNAEAYASLSSAVTQGADAILIDVLKKSGQGAWFRVVERVGLKNLLRERKIVEVNSKRNWANRAYKIREDVMRHREEQSRSAASNILASALQAERTRAEAVAGRIAQIEKDETEKRKNIGQAITELETQIKSGGPKSQSEAQRAQAEQQLKQARAGESARQSNSAEQVRKLRSDEAVLKAQRANEIARLRREEASRRARDTIDYLKQQRPATLPALKIANYIIEGSIVGYDHNEVTGGLGARYLGIGGNTDYRRDIVTISLRLVSIRTGEIVAASNSAKTVYSVLLKSGTYKFVAIDKLLEIEGGVSRNEPATLAVRHAIEHGLHKLVMKAVAGGTWHYRNPGAAVAYYADSGTGSAKDLP